MKRVTQLVLVFLAWTYLASAQTATVTRRVNLRSDVSTASDILEKLNPGDQLQLVDSDKTDGFYHVTAPDGQEGWVWSRNVRVEAQGPTPTPAPTPSPTPAPTPSPAAPQGDLFSRLTQARKPATGEPLIEDGTETCGPTGDATNPAAIALNQNKNRTDVPGDADYIDANWGDLANLPSDNPSTFVGAPVRVVGFLSHRINVENQGTGESTNCHLLNVDEVDWHIYLTNSPAQPISQALIVETTPRTRPAHKWTTAVLTPFVDSQTQVRISGWLMYDSEHIGVIGTQRATVWEVHPITRIEIQSNGQWVDLDSQP